MSNSRKFRRQLQKSPYVQEKIRDRYREMFQQEAKERILFGEEKITMILQAYMEYQQQKTKNEQR